MDSQSSVFKQDVQIQFFDSYIAPDQFIGIQGKIKIQGLEGIKRQGRIIEQAPPLEDFGSRV